MLLSEYRDTKSWQGAVELGPQLMSLADDLPASEESGLAWQLRHLALELPARVAEDLMNGTKGRVGSLLRLLTALELIDHVYPALDTVVVKTAVDELGDWLTGDHFAERLTSGRPAIRPVLAPVRHLEAAAGESAPDADTDHDQPPVPRRLSVAVQADPAETSEQDSHVQPDSGQ